LFYYTRVNKVLLCSCTVQGDSGRQALRRLTAERDSFHWAGSQLPLAIKLQAETCI